MDQSRRVDGLEVRLGDGRSVTLATAQAPVVQLEPGPLDFTLPEDGFQQPEFGGKRLEETLIDVLPAACRQALKG